MAVALILLAASDVTGTTLEHHVRSIRETARDIRAAATNLRDTAVSALYLSHKTQIFCAEIYFYIVFALLTHCTVLHGCWLYSFQRTAINSPIATDSIENMTRGYMESNISRFSLSNEVRTHTVKCTVKPALKTSCV